MHALAGNLDLSLVVRLLNPIVWRWPGRAARKLFSFALAEQGSLLDLTEAARLTPSAERAATYLKHASDEARHARVFASRSAELRFARGDESLGDPRADSDHLFEQLGEIGFLAFVHLGERGGRSQFEEYERYFRERGDDADSAMFSAIVVDEKRHEKYTGELLLVLAGDERRAKKALRRARRWRMWRTWRRLGIGLAGRVYQLAMLLLYVALMPLALLIMLVRPARSGWKALPP